MSREDVFDKLETLILDEEEFVTYKLLSREFKIHVNEAKQYLLDFLTTQKTKENTSLEATYFLAGLQEKDGAKSFKVCIISEKSLEKEKKKFKEITSCHIYSVSKEKPNELLLYNADVTCNRKSQENKDLLVIKHPNVEIKPPTLSKINLLKKDTKPSIKSQHVSVSKNGGSSNVQTNGKNVKLLKDDTKKKEEVESQKLEEISTKIENKKSNTESKAQKPNALASLWQKSEEKSKAAQNEITSKSEGKGKTKSPQETKKSVPKNNIMSMFSKQAEKNAGNSSKKPQISDPIPVKKVEVVTQRVPKKVETSPKKVEIATSSKPEKKPSKSSSKKRKSSQKQTKTSGKQGSGSDSEECKPAKKKHRRIAVFDDSDSNSDCEDMEAEDKAQRSLWLPEEPIAAESQIVPPTPETDDGEDPIPPTPPVVTHKGRKKISKTVKKTFMDEDGFMVTKEEKEVVSESGSDEDPIPTKSSTKESKETSKLNQFTYRKQASLTNFFKRS